jgi:flagellar hook-length control protein FliK
MAPAASPLPVSVQASAVVAQIANQADLYRLPGNKGLRIQLHPEDLGGVLVTVRYSPLGGVELHIDVEHASTGNLVQAGWTDLRNALTSQGISADRLIMNVTTAGNAGPSDFSGGNNNRSDPGSANFSQGSQSGQGQQPGQHQSGTRGWTGPLAGGSALADDNQDVAAVTPLPSRIDYRA